MTWKQCLSSRKQECANGTPIVYNNQKLHTFSPFDSVWDSDPKDGAGSIQVCHLSSVTTLESLSQMYPELCLPGYSKVCPVDSDGQPHNCARKNDCASQKNCAPNNVHHRTIVHHRIIVHLRMIVQHRSMVQTWSVCVCDLWWFCLVMGLPS